MPRPSPGLSPRVRGNPVAPARSATRRRSIPACTGEPPTTGRSTPTARVYPRVYGGTSGVRASARISFGLSPRVRGNPGRPSCPCARSRSIPACTGEPGLGVSSSFLLEVYPRVYGGTGMKRRKRQCLMGLSPRVRGNLTDASEPTVKSRSIPACTGEPQGRRPACRWARVYPRVYGGTVHWDRVRAGVDGLSPRVRGNPHHFARVRLREGSIPACTGEPRRPLRSSHSAWVYPRVYGGTDDTAASYLKVLGLSPRVRGNPSMAPPRIASGWSIPACTGEPTPEMLSSDLTKVYPRVYGGTLPGSRTPRRLGGLSPRVRGNPSIFTARAFTAGSIPACTGEPTALRAWPSSTRVYPRVYGGTPIACGSQGWK